jgi:ABC-type sugar transport system, permease component
MRTSTVLEKCIFYSVLSLGAILMVFPFYWMLSTSFKTPEHLLVVPPQLYPNPIYLESYKTALVKLMFLRYTFNSFFIVVMTEIGTVISCSLIGFGFAMFDFKGKKILFMLMLGTLMMPVQVTMIPTYFIWKPFLDTYLPLIVPSFLGGAFGIFLLHQNFKSLPMALYESALIDGCNPVKILFKIYLPISVPAVTTLVVFTFMGAWNNTLGPLLYIKKRELYTLTLGLLALNNSAAESADLGLKMAAAAITMTPTIIVFLMAQKYFIEGMANAGIKG